MMQFIFIMSCVCLYMLIEIYYINTWEKYGIRNNEYKSNKWPKFKKNHGNISIYINIIYKYKHKTKSGYWKYFMAYRNLLAAVKTIGHKE